ncbi:MAG: adenylate/guanylate cyclase domain-containing protein, partial [Stellaceae bacterium]
TRRVLPYRFEEKLDAQGRVRRYAKGKLGPLAATWEEGFGEWQDNRRITQLRHFANGPLRRFYVEAELVPEPAGCCLTFSAEIECVGLLGFLARHSGIIAVEGRKRIRAVDRLVRESDVPDHVPGQSTDDQITGGARRRLDELSALLAHDPASNGLAPRLVEFLQRAPIVTLRGMRPLDLAKQWRAGANETIELFLAAQARGILVMGWDLLCPRCRGAKVRASRLDELPTGAHCSSCNVDYQRNFTRNVELTFHPAPWLRPLPDGELCLLGQGTTPHVKFQGEVGSDSDARFDLTLRPGPYRFRTVEAGSEVDTEVGADGAIPEIVAQGSGIVLREPRTPGAVSIRNDTDRALYFVIEDRRWAADALMGERVIAMPAFRRLCPEQLLRPGDDAEIGNVAIMFTDLQGSTQLYDRLGDASAYHLVRDHFAFLATRVQRHGGVVVKTVGDAVMAAFHDPADAIKAAMAIQDEVAGFNRSHWGSEIVLKLGVHQGACIAVTAGGVLDYFGATVNIAARLEHQCKGGEIILSDAMLAEGAAREALAGRVTVADSALLRGVSAPVDFVRVTTPPSV